MKLYLPQYSTSHTNKHRNKNTGRKYHLEWLTQNGKIMIDFFVFIFAPLNFYALLVFYEFIFRIKIFKIISNYCHLSQLPGKLNYIPNIKKTGVTAK